MAATRRATKAAPKEMKLVEPPFVVTTDEVAVGTGEEEAAMVPLVPVPPLELPVPVPLEPEPDEPEPELPESPPEVELPLPVGLETAPVTVALTDPVATSDAVADPETTAVAVPEAGALALEDESDEELQERSYKGVVVKELPTIPKLGDGVSGAAS